MKRTTKKHWLDGHTVHGGYFHQFSFHFLSIGCIVAWGKGVISEFNIYILE